MVVNHNLAAGFFHQARSHPDLPALVIARQTTSYGELAKLAARFGSAVAPHLNSGRVGVLASRSLEAYVGILGACMAGATYVPLNLKWPAERLIALFKLLELDALIVDRNGAALLSEDVMAAAPGLVVMADNAEPSLWDKAEGVFRLGALDAPCLDAPVPVGPDHHGYIIFTSGTTGLPKGVIISAASLGSYLAETRPWTQFSSQDRIAEAHDVTFDLSVHNTFLALEAGASLHVMSSLELMAPARFIRSHEITVWMSVPTLANMMRKAGALQPDIFPSLRQSVFCGEPLPAATVASWAKAAPKSSVENIYGPTECTVICMRQSVAEPPPITPGRGTIAIGTPYRSMEIAIVDGNQKPVAKGTPGEIAISGPQLGVGYFAARDQTDERFRVIGGKRWYLTGDLGLQDMEGLFHHLGRTDHQVKVKGNRIELEEVEAHLRSASGTNVVAVVAWPVIDGAAQSLVGFVAGSTIGADDIRSAMSRSLPRYMIPETIHLREELPLNINGKIDRRALLEELEEVAGERRVA